MSIPDLIADDDTECSICGGSGLIEDCMEDVCVCREPPCVWRRCDCNSWRQQRLPTPTEEQHREPRSTPLFDWAENEQEAT